MKTAALILLLLTLLSLSCAAPEVVPEPTVTPAPIIPEAPAESPVPVPPAAESLPETEPLPTLEDGSVLTPGEEYIFTLEASAGDGDGLVFWARNLPPGATFDTETQTFNWTPEIGQVGIYPGVCFHVANEYGEDSECINIIVPSSNNPPELSPVPLKVVDAGSLVTFTLQASDPDGDELEYTAHNLPPGAQFSPPSFSWVPTEAGVWPALSFTVSDGKLKATQRVIIAVRD